MIDSRIPLLKDDCVLLSDSSNQYEFKIVEEIARGSSIIAYKAISNTFGFVILKEFYPIDLEIERESNRLICEDEELFEEEKEEFIKKNLSFIQAIHMNFYDTNVYNNLPKTLIYEKENSCNNTLYMIQSYAFGCVYRDHQEESLFELFQNIRSIVKIARDMHKHGYLLLDIKPSNLFMVKASDHHYFNFVDFDSVLKLSEIDENTIIKSTLKYHDPNVTLDNINESYDLYSIGCMIQERIVNHDFSCVHPKTKILVDECLSHLICNQEDRYSDIDLIQQLDSILDYLQNDYFLYPMTLNKRVFFGYENELSELHKAIQSNSYAMISGINGIGKKALAYEYAYRYQKDYQNIQIVSFENNWLDTLKTLSMNQPIDDEHILTIVLSMFSKYDSNLLVVYDYVSNDQNNKILEYLKRNNLTIILTSNTLLCDVRLEGLMKEDAYQLFESMYTQKMKMGDEAAVYKYIDEVGGNPAMIQLFAHGANQTNVSMWHSPIKTFIQNIHPKKVINFNNKITELEKHIYHILNLKQLSNEIKEIFTLFYFSNNIGLHEQFLLDYGIQEKDLLFMEQEYLITRFNGKVKVNPLFTKEILLNALGIDAFVPTKLFDYLKNVKYPTYKYSILTKVSIADPLFENLFKTFLNKDDCLDVDYHLLKEVNSVIHEYFHYFSDSLKSLIKLISMDNILLNREGKIDELIGRLEENITSNQSIYSLYQLNIANDLQKKSIKAKNEGDFVSAIDYLLQADCIYQQYDLGYIDIIEDCLTIADYCNALGATDKQIFYSKKSIDLCKQANITNNRLLFRCYLEYAIALNYESYFFDNFKDYYTTYSYADNIDNKIYFLEEILQAIAYQFYKTDFHAYKVDDFMFDILLKTINTLEYVRVKNGIDEASQFGMIVIYVYYLEASERRDEAHDLFVRSFREINEKGIKIKPQSYGTILLYVYRLVRSNYKSRLTKSEYLQIITENLKMIQNNPSFSIAISRLEYFSSLAIMMAYMALFYEECREGQWKKICMNYLNMSIDMLKHASVHRFSEYIQELEIARDHFGKAFPKYTPAKDIRIKDYPYTEADIQKIHELNDFLDTIMKEFV